MNNDTTLSNRYWEITIREGERSGPVRVVDQVSGRVYADLPYYYELFMAGFEDVDDLPTRRATTFAATLSVEERPDRLIATLAGTLNFSEPLPGAGVRLRHIIELYADRPCFDERIILENVSGEPLPIRHIKFGFAKLMGKTRWDAELMNQKIYGVPFIVGPADHHRHEYTVWDTINHNVRLDGWTMTDKKRFLLAFKYNQDFIEFAELDGRVLWDEKPEQPNALIFGGVHLWTGPHWGLLSDRTHSMDEVRRRFLAQRPLEFGLTRFYAGDGGWQEGYAAFKSEMRRLGHGLRPDYDPGIHLQSFYDYPWEKYTPEQLQPLLSIGAEIGCETLYLDPKWENESAETIWHTERLGPLRTFIDNLPAQHGLRRELALHVMGTNYYYHETAKTPDEMIARAQSLFPGKTLRVDAHERECRDYCYASRDWIEEKVRRLETLCEGGMTWFMLDFQRWDGPCHAHDHGHETPSTPEDHARGLLEVIQRVRQRYPHVQVELHDVLVAGERERKTPMYYLHGLPHSFDECWGFEYMHMPLNDLLGGDAISLYYYNLAYEIPLYAHINMMLDNQQCLAFWWMASTIRHLGIGGFGDPAQIERYRAALAEYRPLKEFFVKGDFHGPDPHCHIHVLSARNAAVIVLFNLELEERTPVRTLDLTKYGLTFDALHLPADPRYTLHSEGRLEIHCPIPAMSARTIGLGV